METAEEYPLTFETALKAMLDGLVVMDEVHQKPSRFDPESQMFQYYEEYQWYGWNISAKSRKYTRWRVIEFVEEYPLSFDEALRQMLEGKTVVCLAWSHNPIKYTDKFKTGCNAIFKLTVSITEEMQNSRWKVVE